MGSEGEHLRSSCVDMLVSIWWISSAPLKHVNAFLHAVTSRSTHMRHCLEMQGSTVQLPADLGSLDLQPSTVDLQRQSVNTVNTGFDMCQLGREMLEVSEMSTMTAQCGTLV